MMKKLLLLLLLSSLLFAASDPNSFGTFYEDTKNNLNSELDAFIDATGAAGTMGSGVLDTFGPASCDDDWIRSPDGQNTVISLWIVPTIFTGMVVVFGITCVYLLGQALNSPNLTAIAKDEAFQTGLTFIRVGAILGTIMLGNFWYGLSVGGSSDRIYQNNPVAIDAAMAFTRLMVGDMLNHYSMLMLYNMVIHTIYSSTMWFGVTWRAMYSFNLGPVLKPIIDIVGSALQFLSLGVSEWLLHIVTLCFIKKWMWSIFIPMGILLRALPQTRNAGEAILALAFSLAIFYPYMFLFNYEVHKILKLSIIDPQQAMDSFFHSSGILQTFGSVIIVMLLMAGVFVQFFLGTALSLAFDLIKGAVYYIVIMSIFLPFLNVFVTLTAAKETAEFFKADVNFLAFLKII